jgi:hypothetical protein
LALPPSIAVVRLLLFLHLLLLLLEAVAQNIWQIGRRQKGKIWQKN